MRRRRGLSIIELMVAMVIALIGFYELITVFRSHYQAAHQGRNRVIACELIESLMDELEDHPYGLPAPPSWAVEEERPAALWIEGRQQDVTFHKKLEYQNGGFVGKTQDATDLVTITVTWSEGTGGDQSAHATDDRQMVVRVPVWR